jgi:non-haem Fe2+, alpha-ketoglutarate-dependent halogenase
MIMTTTTQFGLSKTDVIRFRNQGYLPGPYDLCSPDEMAAIRHRVDVEVLGTDPPFAHAIPPDEQRSLRVQYRNLDRKVVWDLCSHPAVTGAIGSILGRDLILWRSLFFHKPPGGDGTKWHTDAKFWPMLDPQINVTAWIALTDTDTATACMQVIPGSHKMKAPHVGSSDYDVADFAYADIEQIDLGRAVAIPLRAGQFFLLDERILHGSDANYSKDRRRLGLAVRATIPYVRVDHAQLFPGHKVMVLRGIDSVDINAVADPPAR